MAIGVRAVSTGANASSSSQATPLPTGTTTGDVTIIAAMQTSTAFAFSPPATLTAPAGWTTLVNCNGALVCYRVWHSGDTTTPTITSTASLYWISGAITYTGCDTTNPVDVFASCLAIKSITPILRAPTLAPNFAADQLVLIFLDGNAGGSTITLPSGFTARQASTAGPSMRICDKSLTTAGAQTGYAAPTGPVSAGGYLEAAISIALKAASASAATPDPPAPVICGSWDTIASGGSPVFPVCQFNPQVGDLCVVFIVSIDTITTPSGWTRIGSALGGWVFTHTVAAGDPSNVTFTSSAGNYANMDAMILRRSGSGVANVALDKLGTGTGLGAATAPSLALAQATELLLVHFGGEDATAHAWSSVTAGLTVENAVATGPNSRLSWLWPAPNPSGAFSATLASSARNDAFAALFSVGAPLVVSSSAFVVIMG